MNFWSPWNLSQKELAEALGITRVRLSEIFRGKWAITPDTVRERLNITSLEVPEKYENFDYSIRG
jgi:plasmid maintenance system antidote protein VapI